jgi:hypothetical protein
MKKIKFILFILLGLSFFSLYSQWQLNDGDKVETKIESNVVHEKEIREVVEASTNLEDQPSENKYDGIHKFMGASGEEIKAEWGNPDRIDLSAYDHVWWIYQEREDMYIQFGILENRVVTIYGIGEGLNIDPFYIGQPYDEISKKFPISSSHSLQAEDNSYRFELTEEEARVRPLFQFGDVWAQLYYQVLDI